MMGLTVTAGSGTSAEGDAISELGCLIFRSFRSSVVRGSTFPLAFSDEKNRVVTVEGGILQGGWECCHHAKAVAAL